MKQKLSLVFQIILLCGIAACVMKESNDWQRQIIGRYVTQYQQPYSTGWDTILIEKINEAKQVQFQITKSTLYRRIHNGKAGEPNFKKSNWLAEPDNHLMALTTIPVGRKYRFDPGRNTITTGNTIYQKIQ